jgi:hypothetical protein
LVTRAATVLRDTRFDFALLAFFVTRSLHCSAGGSAICSTRGYAKVGIGAQPSHTLHGSAMRHSMAHDAT